MAPLTGALSIASWFYRQAPPPPRPRVVSGSALVAEGAGVRRASGGGGGGRESAVHLAIAPIPSRVTVAVSVTERATRLSFGARRGRRPGGGGAFRVIIDDVLGRGKRKRGRVAKGEAKV